MPDPVWVRSVGLPLPPVLNHTGYRSEDTVSDSVPLPASLVWDTLGAPFETPVVLHTSMGDRDILLV